MVSVHFFDFLAKKNTWHRFLAWACSCVSQDGHRLSRRRFFGGKWVSVQFIGRKNEPTPIFLIFGVFSEQYTNNCKRMVSALTPPSRIPAGFRAGFTTIKEGEDALSSALAVRCAKPAPWQFGLQKRSPCGPCWNVGLKNPRAQNLPRRHRRWFLPGPPCSLSCRLPPPTKRTRALSWVIFETNPTSHPCDETNPRRHTGQTEVSLRPPFRGVASPGEGLKTRGEMAVSRHAAILGAPEPMKMGSLAVLRLPVWRIF